MWSKLSRSGSRANHYNLDYAQLRMCRVDSLTGRAPHAVYSLILVGSFRMPLVWPCVAVYGARGCPVSNPGKSLNVASVLGLVVAQCRNIKSRIALANAQYHVVLRTGGV